MATESLDGVDLQEGEWDEVAAVLAALRELAAKVSSPTIRACLEAAGDDIAHLAGTGATD